MPFMPIVTNRSQRTIKQTLRTIRINGCTAGYRSDLREFRVNVRGGNERSAYYTNDRDDAIKTAKVMAESEVSDAFLAERS